MIQQDLKNPNNKKLKVEEQYKLISTKQDKDDLKP